MFGEIAFGATCLAEDHGTPAESVFNSVGSVERVLGLCVGDSVVAHTKSTNFERTKTKSTTADHPIGDGKSLVVDHPTSDGYTDKRIHLFEMLTKRAEMDPTSRPHKKHRKNDTTTATLIQPPKVGGEQPR